MMTKVFERWTVLSHEPLEKHSENLWSVRGTMPDGKTTRVMSVAKLSDGRLLIHNGIALEEPLMAEIEAFGEPALLVVPNGFHRQDAKVFKVRYPKLTVLCPRGAKKRVSSVVPVDGSYDQAPEDSAVRLAHLEGTKATEGIVEVRSSSGTTLVFNDVICNMPPLDGLPGLLLSPTGNASVPRFARWFMVKDRGAFKAHLDRLARLDQLQRIVISHGRAITDAPGSALRAISAEA